MATPRGQVEGSWQGHSPLSGGSGDNSIPFTEGWNFLIRLTDPDASS